MKAKSGYPRVHTQSGMKGRTWLAMIESGHDDSRRYGGMRLTLLTVLFLLLAVIELAGTPLPRDTQDTTATAESISVAEPETVAVATRGILYLFGNRLEPTFVFTICNDTLWVNDYYFMGKPGPEPKREVPEIAKKQHQLNVEVGEEIFRLLAQGVSYDSVTARAAQMYRQSDLIDSVEVITKDSLAALVRYWRSKPWPDYLTIPHFVPPPKPPFVERLKKEARLAASGLQAGGMLIWGSKFSMDVSPLNVARREAQIRKVKQQGYALPEDERNLHAPPGALEELIKPRRLKKRGDRR